MARIRSIKPEITLDEDLADLGFAARYFFLNLWCHCDREGRCEDRPKKLQALILPWDPEVDANVLLDELTPKFLIRYEIAGKRYIQVKKFLKHQRPHKTELQSEIPPFSDEKTLIPRLATENSVGKGKGEGKGDGEGKGGCIVAAPKGAAKENRELTPQQIIVRYFKEAKGVNADDKEWDRKHWNGRLGKEANAILKAFDGNVLEAGRYILVKGEEWEHLPDWGLNGVVAAAGRDPRVNGGTENGSEYKQVESDRGNGQGSARRFTQSRDLAGDALRAIEHSAVCPEESSDLGSADDDFASDQD